MKHDSKSGKAGKMVTERKVMAAIGFLLCAVLTGCGMDRALTTPVGEPVGEAAEAMETEEERVTQAVIYVYVCGAVNAPGVVVLPEESRVQDALEAAGGLREDAAGEAVNLAERLSDGVKLYFPTAEEADALESQEQAQNEGLININTAGEELLCTLPGIGEARAAAIVAYREENGAFQRPEDIMKVNGIKESAYSKIKDKITIE